MTAFLAKESNEKRISQREEHYRKAAALFAELSNDYEEAMVKMAEYKHGPAPVPQVLHIHEQIVARKKERMDDAEKDYERCIEMYNDQCFNTSGKPVQTEQTKPSEDKDATIGFEKVFKESKSKLSEPC